MYNELCSFIAPVAVSALPPSSEGLSSSLHAFFLLSVIQRAYLELLCELR